MGRNKFGIICFILALFSFFISLLLNYEKLNIPYFNGLFTPVAVNIEISNKYQNSIKINGETFNSPANQATDVIISKVLYGKVEKLELNSDNTEAFKNISSVDIFVGRKFYHFNQSSLKITNNTINLPIEGNYRGNLNAVIVSFLALFYNLRYFVITWIFLIAGLFLLEYKPHPNNKWLFWCIFCFAILCRFNQFTAYPLWWDEVFVINLPASHIYPISSIFIDPGNPSFFYLIMKIYTCFAPLTIEFMRLVPVILGSFGTLGIYLLTNKFSNQKSAILATFIAAISIYHICYSQELRGYSLILLIVPFVIISLFDYLKNSNAKNFLKLFLTSSIMINTHLFGLFLLLTNFIYGISKFIKSRENFKRYFNFTICHVLIFLTFAPYLLINFVKTLTGREGFNSHLEKASLDVIFKVLSANFGNIFILFLFITLCIFLIKKNKTNTPETIFEKYGIFTFILFYTTAIIVSNFRPLLHEYYFIVLYPLFISLFAVLIVNLYTKYSNLWLKIGLVILTILMIGSQSYNNSWKMKNQKENIVNLVNARAEDNNNENIFIYIQPKRVKDYYTYKDNVIAGTSVTKFCKTYYISKDELLQYTEEELKTLKFQNIKTSFGNISDITKIKLN